MNRSMLRFFLVLALMAVGLSPAAGADTLSSPAVAPTVGAIKIGLLMPETGPVSEMGANAANGALQAIAEAVAGGMSIEVFRVDSECSESGGASAAQTAINIHGAHYLVGAICSSASRAAADVADAAGVLMISPASSGLYVTREPDGTDKEFVYRACMLDGFAPEAAAVLATELNAKKAVTLHYTSNPWEEGSANVFRDRFVALGGAVPLMTSFDLGITDLGALATQVQGVAPDVVFMIGAPDGAAQVANAVRAKGISPTFMGTEAWDVPDLDTTALDGGVFVGHWAPEDPRPLVSQFIAGYHAAHGKAPGILAALAYDATRVLLQAIRAADVDDAVLVKGQLDALPHEGVTGRWVFDEYGDPIRGAAVIRISDGGRVFQGFREPIGGLTVLVSGAAVEGVPVHFQAQIVVGTAVSYTWDFADGYVAWGADVSHAFAGAGDYAVELTATNGFGAVQADYQLTVHPRGDSTVYLPVALKP